MLHWLRCCPWKSLNTKFYRHLRIESIERGQSHTNKWEKGNEVFAKLSAVDLSCSLVNARREYEFSLKKVNHKTNKKPLNPPLPPPKKPKQNKQKKPLDLYLLLKQAQDGESELSLMTVIYYTVTKLISEPQHLLTTHKNILFNNSFADTV